MVAKLKLEQVFADGTIANITRDMLSGLQRRNPLEERMKRTVDWERLAEMSLSALLFYVLIGDGGGTDEFA